MLEVSKLLKSNSSKYSHLENIYDASVIPVISTTAEVILLLYAPHGIPPKKSPLPFTTNFPSTSIAHVIFPSVPFAISSAAKDTILFSFTSSVISVFSETLIVLAETPSANTFSPSHSTTDIVNIITKKHAKSFLNRILILLYHLVTFLTKYAFLFTIFKNNSKLCSIVIALIYQSFSSICFFPISISSSREYISISRKSPVG